jgi:phosphoenolpyruvate-protein phosphotransferase/dihydroxyacetone kinase phosphotransfer subunit
MVGLVLVSHSRNLALALQEMLGTLYGGRARVAIAAGAGDAQQELGTDATAIMAAIAEMDSPAGVAVLLDLGSAILSAETALDLLDEDLRSRVALCAAPLVEGAIAAAALSTAGASLHDVRAEAESALRQKTQHLTPSAVPLPLPTAATDNLVAADTASVVLRVENRQGLHARPAMRIVQTAAQFQSTVQIENLRAGGPPASARSLVEVTCLEARQGDSIRVTARGADAAEAIRAFAALGAERFGDAPDGETDRQPATTSRPDAAGDARPAPTGVGEWSGQALSEGIAIGPIFFAAREIASLPVAGMAAADADVEIGRLETALAAVRQQLDERALALHDAVGQGNAAIFQAQRILLDDPALHRAAVDSILAERLSAPQAWQKAGSRVAATYRQLQQPLLAERAADVEDLNQQVLEKLGLGAAWRLDLPPEPCILAVPTLLPSEVAALDPQRVRGIMAEAIGTTSHAAILLRAAGLPAITGVPMAELRARAAAGSEVALDGDTGEIWIRPDAAARSTLLMRRQPVAVETAQAGPIHTRDGVRVEIAANVATVAEADAAARAGAEAIGLLRTEFLFFERAEPPTEDEQTAALRQIAAALPVAVPVTVRTLDIGGDKPVAYLPATPEANPFLGVRGLRLALRRRELFLVHLRAILRAAHGRPFRVMFPMVTEVEEIRLGRAALLEAHEQLARAGTPHAWPIETGMMVEVPAAALNARSFIPEIDFFSIGTNDLTQYTLAAERGHPLLTGYDDALHPAVLRLIGLVASTANRHGKWAGVCGEAAADPLAAAVFVGLGVRELSVGAATVARLRGIVSQLDLRQARPLARRCLVKESAKEVRSFLDRPRQEKQA